jgi:Amt family ammonium transporter
VYEASKLDILWVLASSVLVLLMQGGFLCLESGLTRSKNAINVALKNASDFLIATLVWFLLGFGLMFGASHQGWIGTSGFAPSLGGSSPGSHVLHLSDGVLRDRRDHHLRRRCRAHALQRLPPGHAADRGLIYPVFGHWAWGGALAGTPGWLKQLGFVDFAGSTVVHSVGGWVALAAVLVIGPRRGRFDRGLDRAIPGSNLPLAMLGVLLFLVGWIGFNGGSTLALSDAVPIIILNTLLSGAAGGVAAYLATRWVESRHLDRIAMPLNGVIAGLVAITAGCHVVTRCNRS